MGKLLKFSKPNISDKFWNILDIFIRLYGKYEEFQEKTYNFIMTVLKPTQVDG